MSKCTKSGKLLCSHLLNGVQGRSPCKKKHCHPEARPQTAWRRRISCRPNLQGRRGACTEWFDVHNRKIIVKRSCLHIQKA